MSTIILLSMFLKGFSLNLVFKGNELTSSWPKHCDCKARNQRKKLMIHFI